MFGFLTAGPRDLNDPLISVKSASQWLRGLPAQDVIGRQQMVLAAFDTLRQSRNPVDPARVQAVLFLDAALGADRRQLAKQYVENADSGSQLSQRIWKAAFDLSQGYISTYQALLQAALLQSNNPRWKPLVPLLFARQAHSFLRHRRQASRIPLRALDSRQVGRAPSGIHARGRARRRSGPDDSGPWTQHDAMDRRAGVRLRPADPSAQLRQHVACRARLGLCTSPRLESALVARRGRAFDGGIPGRCRRQDRIGAPRRQRCRPDAALSGHHARLLPSRSSDRLVASRRIARSCADAFDQSAAHHDPREDPPCRRAELNADKRRDSRKACGIPHRARPGRTGAHLPRARVERREGRGRDRSRQPGADRLHGRRRRTRQAPAARRTRFDRSLAILVHRSDVARQGPQHRGPADRRHGRRRAGAFARCAGRGAAIRRFRVAARRRAAIEQDFTRRGRRRSRDHRRQRRADHAPRQARVEGRNGIRGQRRRCFDDRRAFRGAVSAATIAARQAPAGQDDDHSDVGVRRRPQCRPDHRPLGLHDGAAASDRAARRLELDRGPDHRQKAARLTTSVTRANLEPSWRR